MIDIIDFKRQTTCRDTKGEKAIYAMLPFFHDTVVMGDSLAESILDFRLLRKNNVVAKRGRVIDSIDGDLLRVYCLQPKIVFMEYGKCDVRYFLGDEKKFIRIYKEQIKRLYQHHVEKIYVNSIIPMRSDVVDRYGGLEAFNRFNNALRDMCKELDITFIDNSQLMQWRDEIFEYDGIHPKYPYYQKWLRNMIEYADLKSEE